MAYATREDMEKRFDPIELVQLSDRVEMAVFNEEVFAQAQLDGDADIDIRIQKRYPLPLPNIPTILVRLACDLYFYHLHKSLVPESAEKKYNAAIKVLNEIRDGNIDLNPPAPGDPVQEPTSSATPFRVTTPERLFSEAKLKAY